MSLADVTKQLSESTAEAVAETQKLTKSNITLRGQVTDLKGAVQNSAKAEKRVLDTRPDLLIGSPMCKYFSPWQRLNEAKSNKPERYQENKASSRKHLQFVCRNYRHQYDGGLLFLHEHPQQASSWDEECIEELMSLPGVGWVDMHQCQLGQNDGEGNPVKKPTRWLSNSKHILQMLNVKCRGRGGWCW